MRSFTCQEGNFGRFTGPSSRAGSISLKAKAIFQEGFGVIIGEFQFIQIKENSHFFCKSCNFFRSFKGWNLYSGFDSKLSGISQGICILTVFNIFPAFLRRM